MLIKVCGMRDPMNIRAVEALDVNFMGFIFYARSPRYVPSDPVFTSAIRNCKRLKTGVFVNESADVIINTVNTLGLDFVQLHGNESVQTCKILRSEDIRIIKAFSIAEAEDIKRVYDYEDYCSFFLFDTKCEAYGGSGRRFDWSVLNDYNGERPFFLSGGLTPDMLDDILAFKHPCFAGIDLNSGFEISPALKDVAKLQVFIVGAGLATARNLGQN
ncbi:MAG: phosphoribosylanthranilate isomerase [Tannerella sp.]|jgi:phosphoribosylanthranilate isomerase|nr:phosphoribosylanthranilate isomerase [Tannerella sp.]